MATFMSDLATKIQCQTIFQPLILTIDDKAMHTSVFVPFFHPLLFYREFSKLVEEQIVGNLSIIKTLGTLLEFCNLFDEYHNHIHI